MSNVALYTFGLLDPDAGPAQLADFSRRGAEIFAASEDAPGFVGRAESGGYGAEAHAGNSEPWGAYALPLDLPDFEGHDPTVHIATLSVWVDVESARGFVYRGLHREALKLRYDWFLKGPWPGHVLWRIEDGFIPSWTDGVQRLQELAGAGESANRFTFTSTWSRSPL